jgi:hypothetical protein
MLREDALDLSDGDGGADGVANPRRARIAAHIVGELSAQMTDGAFLALRSR